MLCCWIKYNQSASYAYSFVALLSLHCSPRDCLVLFNSALFCLNKQKKSQCILCYWTNVMSVCSLVKAEFRSGIIYWEIVQCDWLLFHIHSWIKTFFWWWCTLKWISFLNLMSTFLTAWREMFNYHHSNFCDIPKRDGNTNITNDNSRQHFWPIFVPTHSKLQPIKMK